MSWGSADFTGFIRLRDELNEKLPSEKTNEFIEVLSREIAQRLLDALTNNTPVSVGLPTSGTLRRGWTGGKEVAPYVYIKSVPIQHTGKRFQITLRNPVPYSEYVNYGHRTGKNLDRWVEGKFFMEISEDQIQEITEPLIQKRVTTYLKGIFNND